MKKLSTIIITIALILGMSQCKKNVETITPSNIGETVHITVNVGDGGKHIVYPGTGAYVFENGDKIYVGDGSKYLGTLTYGSGTFGGDITKPAVGDYLYFYFLGGIEITPADATTSYTISIADQSSQLPVLSCGRSSSAYTDENATYSCTLLNKCALVKFSLTAGTTNAVSVAGMTTGATINFNDPNNAIVANSTTGAINLKSENTTEKWAILLPQAAVDDAAVTIGSGNYTVDVPAITANAYITSGVEIDNAPSGPVFSVSATKTVHFSPGNLQYNHNATNKWRFATIDNLCLGTWDTSGWVDLFGWGTGDDPTKVTNNIQDYLTFYDWGDYCGDPTGNSYTWYTMDVDEWEYLINERTNSEELIANATVNGVKGMIILPDNSLLTLDPGTNFNANVISESEWNETYESSGAVFLPVAGRRDGDNVSDVGTHGYYWSSSFDYDDMVAQYLYLERRTYMSNDSDPSIGYSVRLVRDAN